ncbi:hypothetical protein AB395_0000540 [Sinorhizobium fredii CCBAU 45436]|nr:hypothetical protein AB395_0000540 [Sinorhizobium fredii CCBAU 45436]
MERREQGHANGFYSLVMTVLLQSAAAAAGRELTLTFT